MSEKSARAVISKSSSSLRISLAESSKEFAVVLATMDDKHVEVGAFPHEALYGLPVCLRLTSPATSHLE